MSTEPVVQNHHETRVFCQTESLVVKDLSIKHCCNTPGEYSENYTDNVVMLWYTTLPWPEVLILGKVPQYTVIS